ncbi:hypothetical protein TWF506_004686 [Arthrobotrys conoides]|uniref:F-box domain-containing protein n=1 Tax=Arthrobotrys conoides TaxID=74498 RepID=A0AAN8RI23_9PEZI
MAVLMNLPNEIIHHILSYIKSDGETNIFLLRQINHRFNAHITPLFYENFTIPYETYASFPSILKSTVFNPENENVGYIRRLSIRTYISDSESRHRCLGDVDPFAEHLGGVREGFKNDMKKDIEGLIGRLRVNQLVGFECTVYQLVDYKSLLSTQRSLQQLFVNPVELVPHILSAPNEVLPCLQNLYLDGFRPFHESQHQLLAKTLIQPYASKLAVLSIDLSEDTSDGSPSIHHLNEILETSKTWVNTNAGPATQEPEVISLEFPELQELSIHGCHKFNPEFGFIQIPIFDKLFPLTSLKRLTITHCTQFNQTYNFWPTAFPSLTHLHIERSLTVNRVAAILANSPQLSHIHLSQIPKSTSPSASFRRAALWRHFRSLESLWLGHRHISVQGLLIRPRMSRKMYIHYLGKYFRNLREIAVGVPIEGLFSGTKTPTWGTLPALRLLRVLEQPTTPEPAPEPVTAPMSPSEAIKKIWTMRSEQSRFKMEAYPKEFWFMSGIWRVPVYSVAKTSTVEIFKSWIGEGGEVVIKKVGFGEARRAFPDSLILGAERDRPMWETP